LEKKETFYNTTTVCKTTDLKKARASVFSCDLQSNPRPIYVNSEENFMISPYKTLVTSNCVLTTNYSDNHNHIKEEDFLMSSPNNKEINIDRLNTNDQEPDILDSIKSIGNIIGTNIAKSNLKNDDVTRLSELNSKLNNIEIKHENYDDGKEYKNSRLNSYINDSKNLLVENNMIRRDTFIDNNFNKKFRIYDKDIIVQEINKNSDLRLKKYEILFDFIGNNMKELTELVNAKPQNIVEEKITNKNQNIKLHRIKGKALSIDNTSNQINMPPRKILTDFDKSMVESSNEEEFYQDLLDHTFVNIGNFSNEMSSLRSKFDISLFGNKFDLTQNQYDDKAIKNKQNLDMPSYNDDTFTVPEEMEGSRIRKNTPSFM